jgi:iron complex outermembrane receptor protein
MLRNLLIVIFVLLPLGASGQEVQQDRVELEEVTVTALRREAALFKLPDAITVFDQATIDAVGIERLNDVARLTPNLRFSDDQEVGVGTVTIRGVTQNRGIGETPVAFIVDGVAVNNSLVSTQDFFDVTQIEVLRGPQGALHGRNAVAGAINITTALPTDEFSARLSSRIAQGDDYQLEAALSGPVLDDRLLVRLSGFWQQRDGQLTSETLGVPVDFKDSTALRLRALYETGDRLSVDFRYQHSDQQGGSGYFMPGSVDSEENRLPGDPFPFPLNNTTFTIQSNLLGVSDVVFDDVTLKLDYSFTNVTLTSITSHNDIESNNDQDLDQTGQEFLNILVNDDSSQFSQELRLASTYDGRISWIAGLFYSDQTRDRSLATFLNVGGFATGGDWGSDNAFFVPQPPAVLNEDYQTRSAFAQVNVDLTDELELILAGRMDRVERRNDTSNPLANGMVSFTEFQPKVQLAWSPTAQLGLFATFAEGFRPGGFNTLANAPEVSFGTRFESESLFNYELGARYRSAQRKWELNAAIFHVDYRDQQFFLFDPFGSQALINADESRIRGGELEATWRPNEALTLMAAYGLTDSRIEQIDQQPGLTVPFESIVGNPVPNAPEYSINFSVDYRFQLAALEAFGRLDLERRGRTWFTIDGENFQDPYSIVDLRFGVARGNWSATAFVENVLNEEWIEFYFSRQFIGLRTDIAWPSPDRLAGVEVTYRY